MKIHYVSGSRADFGLMRRLLTKIHESAEHELGIIVTGQHTNLQYGNTDADIEASGLPIVHRIDVRLSGSDGVEMARALALEIEGLTRFWSDDRPDMVLLLGDRGEMLAGALAAIHLGIHVGHIGGGERSGTLDESFRHAISKLSHFHFPTTPLAAERLKQMGEDAANIYYIGAPGLVALGEESDRAWLEEQFSIPPQDKAALVVFHPVVQQADEAGRQFRTVLEAVRNAGYQCLVLHPNSDAGGAAINREIDKLDDEQSIRVVAHLERADYSRALASVDLMIGNSSSGIIESASLGVPCVNVGLRQQGRDRNANTIDCDEITPESIATAIGRAEALSPGTENIYGDGNADDLFMQALSEIELSPEKLNKMNAY